MVIDAMDSPTKAGFENYKPITFREYDPDSPEMAKFAQEVFDDGPEAVAERMATTLEEGRGLLAMVRDVSVMLTREIQVINDKAAKGLATDEELTHAVNMMPMAQNLLTKAREGGTIAGQTLALQRREAGRVPIPEGKPKTAPKEADSVKPPEESGGLLPPKTEDKMPNVMSEEMYRGDSMESRVVQQQVLESIGGGDVARGRKRATKMVKEFAAVTKAQGEGAAIRHASRTARTPHMLTEYWMNSILSGPLTHLVNATSNTAHTFFRPFEKALGQAAAFNFQGAVKELSFFAHLSSQFMDSIKAAGLAWKNWGDEIDNIGKFDTDTGFDRAIAAKNFGMDPQDMGGAAVDWIGKALNLPSRALLTSDAFFKNINYRAEVRAGLFREGAGLKLTGDALDKHVQEGLQKMIGDGQFYNYKNVRMSAEKAAIDKVSHITDPAQRVKAMKTEVQKYMDENWDAGRGALAVKARDYGREITFTRDLKDPNRAGLVKVAAKWNSVTNDFPFLRIVTPFVRTPTNLIAFFLNRTAGAAIEVAKGGFAFGGQKLPVKAINRLAKSVSDDLAEKGATRADLLGRVSTGGMFIYGATMAYEAGSITGGGPKDPERRRLMQANGWQPYSIRVGDTYINYRRLDPFANFLGAVADYNEAMAEADPKDRQTLEGVMGAALFSVARNVTNKSYLTGLARVANVLANPERYGATYLEQTIASFGPYSSLASQTLGNDEHDKEVRSILDAVRSKYGLDGHGTGGFEGRVETRRNIFGEKVQRAAIRWPWPAQYTSVKDDMVMNELNSLGHGFSPPKPVHHGIVTTDFMNDKGQTFYDRWQEQHGLVRINGRTLKQAVKKLIKSAAYQRLPMEDFEGNRSPRIDAIDRIKRKYRTKAWEETLDEFPEVKRLDLRNTKIKAYRKAGRDIQSLLDF